MQGLIQQGLAKGAELADKAIYGVGDKIGLSDTAKDMLRQYKNKAIGGISDFASSLGKPSMPSNHKPAMPHNDKPKLSGWDKFKNGLASIWNATGAKLTGKEAHIIKEQDYNPTAPDAEKNGFSWSAANRNFEQEHGRKRGDWDSGKIIGTGVKVASMV